MNSLFETGELEKAVPMLLQLIAKEPNLAILYSKLGGTYMKLHQYDKAAPILRKAVALDPASTTAQMDLGRSLLRTQDFDGAATVFETLIAKIPALLDRAPVSRNCLCANQPHPGKISRRAGR